MYTTKDNVEAILKRQLTTGESTYFEGVLSKSIDSYINYETGLSFGSTDTVDVYVSGNGAKRLVIPTMYEIESISFGDTLISDDYWQTFPAQPPYLALTHKNSVWTEGVDNYTVRGKLGYANVPQDITAVATEMAVNYFSPKVDEETGSRIKSERSGDYSVTYADYSGSISASSLSTLHTYRRLSRSI